MRACICRMYTGKYVLKLRSSSVLRTDGTPLLTSTCVLWTFNPPAAGVPTSHRTCVSCTWSSEPNTMAHSDSMSLQMRPPQQAIMRSAWQKKSDANWQTMNCGGCETEAPLCLMPSDMFLWLCAQTHWEALNLPEQTGDGSILSHTHRFLGLSSNSVIEARHTFAWFNRAYFQGKKRDVVKVSPPLVPSVFLQFHLTAGVLGQYFRLFGFPGRHYSPDSSLCRVFWQACCMAVTPCCVESFYICDITNMHLWVETHQAICAEVKFTT